MLAVILAALLAVPLLGLVTFVQLLYLESLRLRTRDLPALKFFKETLEDKIGLKTEDGAGTFSLIKHTVTGAHGRLLPGMAGGRQSVERGQFLAGCPGGLALHGGHLLRVAASAVPPHHRPLAAAAGSAAARPGPAGAAHGGHAVLFPIADRPGRRPGRQRRRAHLRRKHRSLDFRRHRRGTHRRGRPQADSVRGRVRRQGGARSHDAAAQHRGHLRRCHAGRIAPDRHHRTVLAHSRLRTDPSTR